MKSIEDSWKEKTRIMQHKTKQWPLAISYTRNRYNCMYDRNVKFDLEKKRRY